MYNEILVSVVIPVKNGDHWLKETIPAILDQKLDGKLEIVVIDSGSTDNSLTILGEYGIEPVHIKPEEYNHGLTRNVGVRHSRGHFVVLTVQDAKPVSSHWLKMLMEGFVDETVAGVCGLQIVPHHLNKNPVEWFRPVSRPAIRKYHFRNQDDFLQLDPQKQLEICRWDDVNAMYKREVLLQIPFRETDFAEDVLWAKDALMAGHSIVYNPSAQVEHYHFGDYFYSFRRNFIVQYHFYKFFGVLPDTKHHVRRKASKLKTILSEPGIGLKKKLYWIRYNYVNQKAVRDSNRMLVDCISSGKPEKLENMYKNLILAIPQAPREITK